MNKFVLALAALLIAPAAQANGTLTLSNDAWPPFIIEGIDQGTAEQLVCRAMERSGWQCVVKVQDWNAVLESARDGRIDGIAAAWKNPEREEYLLFSEAYLTNRIVPVIDANRPVPIASVADLAGHRIALVADYAYGEDIEAAKGSFQAVHVRNSYEAIQAVREGRADAALVDELVARDQLEGDFSGIVATRAVLAFRSLHFAVSRQHPQAAEIIDDFQRAYSAMLADGSVNEILNLDWLATDFGQKGSVSVVMRSGVSLDDLSNPENDGNVYALEASEFEILKQRDASATNVQYQVDGQSYSTLQSAMDDVFGKQRACQHKEFTSTFDCTNLFKR